MECGGGGGAKALGREEGEEEEEERWQCDPLGPDIWSKANVQGACCCQFRSMTLMDM